MTLARPELLVLAPLVALLLALSLVWQWRRLQRLAAAYGGRAVRRLIPVALDRFPSVRLACLVTAGLALGIAAAGPGPAEPPEDAEPSPLDLAIAVDVSLSMIADDTGPSRIERAREVIARISEEVPSSRTVLVVFAGWPYTLVPPTDDPEVIRYFARSLGADLLLSRDQGTSLAATIMHARDALDARPRPNARRAILVLSDGGVHEADDDVLEITRAVAAEGVQVWTAGLGTSRGTRLTRGEEPVVDARGGAVLASLNEPLLRSVAAEGGGRYLNVSDDGGLRSLAAEISELSGEAGSGGSGPSDVPFWLTLLAIPLLLWEGALDAGRGLGRGRRGSTDR